MTLLEKPQPPSESAAQRYNREVAQRRGDWATDQNGNLVYVAPSSTGGRIDREYLKRKGDVWYKYVNDEPVAQYDANGRNEREFVDYTTGDSAVTGAGTSDRYSMLKGKSTPPSGLTSPSKTQTSVALSWTAQPGAVSYRVKDGNTVVAAAVSGTTYSHTGLTANSAHSYTVSTLDGAGNRSAESAALAVTTNA